MAKIEQQLQIGEVKAVCLRPDSRDFPKCPQPKIMIGRFGVEGDAHSGPLRPSHRNPSVLKYNDRAVSVNADEVRVALNQESLLGVNIQPGGFNENILVSGLGDLGDLKSGDGLVFENGVVLQIHEQSMPCTKLEAFYGGAPLIKATTGRDWNRRGILAIVIETGFISPGESVIIIKPGENED